MHITMARVLALTLCLVWRPDVSPAMPSPSPSPGSNRTWRWDLQLNWAADTGSSQLASSYPRCPTSQTSTATKAYSDYCRIPAHPPVPAPSSPSTTTITRVYDEQRNVRSTVFAALLTRLRGAAGRAHLGAATGRSSRAAVVDLWPCQHIDSNDTNNLPPVAAPNGHVQAQTNAPAPADTTETLDPTANALALVLIDGCFGCAFVVTELGRAWGSRLFDGLGVPASGSSIRRGIAETSGAARTRATHLRAGVVELELPVDPWTTQTHSYHSFRIAYPFVNAVSSLLKAVFSRP
ncbi:hypothetical protein C8F01DRAFT_1231824, partial [Mycena amicta]